MKRIRRIRPSKHFIDRWLERVGTNPPGPRELAKMVENSVRVQNGDADLKLPGIYWYTEGNLILKIDVKNIRAITVLVPGINDRKGNQNQGALY